MANHDWFEGLSEELLHVIFAKILAPGDGGSSQTKPLAALRLTCKAWAIAGLRYVKTLCVRDDTEVRHLRRIVEHADDKWLKILDARLSESNEGSQALVEELGRHAWEHMHLEGAARNATVWECSTGTLTTLSTNNWGQAFRASAQEKAWKAAGESGDFSYFQSIAGFPMLDASLGTCICLREVELTLEPLNLNWHLRFAPERPWRLEAVHVLTVKVGRPEHDGEGSVKSILAKKPHSEYRRGFDLLSAAFPQVAHVKFPTWRFPLGNDIEVLPSLAGFVGWKGVRILEMGTAGLPYARGARVAVGSIVKRLQVFNWPDVERLVIWGTHCHRDSWPFEPFVQVYDTFVRPDRYFLRKLKELVIEHPVERLSLVGSEHQPESLNVFGSRQERDEKDWRYFLWHLAVLPTDWVGKREDLPNPGSTSLLTISR